MADSPVDFGEAVDKWSEDLKRWFLDADVPTPVAQCLVALSVRFPHNLQDQGRDDVHAEGD